MNSQLFLLACILSVVLPRPLAARVHVVQGTPASSLEAPWAVRIFEYAVPSCTGSLVGSRWVLSAAHCFKEPIYAYLLKAGGDGTDARLRDLPAIKEIHKKPGHGLNSDLALVELSADVLPAPDLAPITMDPSLPLPPATEVSIYGWGAVAYGGRSSPRLMRMRQRISESFTHAERRFLERRPVYSSPEFVFLSGTQTTCAGDSGAGWIVSTPEGPRLVAVVSAGNHCESLSIGTRLGTEGFMDWINQTMGN